jgi:hypothetical protein
LAQDLPELLALWGAGAPTIWVLLRIFVAEHLFKGTALVIQLNNLVGVQTLGWRRGQKEFVDKRTNQFPTGHCFGTLGSGLPRDDHAARECEVRQGLQPILDVADVEELAPHLRFWMLQRHVTRMLQAGAHFRVVK